MIVGNDFERAEPRARTRSLDFVGDLAAAAACGEKINISISILYPLIRLRQAEKKMRDRPVRFSCCFFSPLGESVGLAVQRIALFSGSRPC